MGNRSPEIPLPRTAARGSFACCLLLCIAFAASAQQGPMPKPPRLFTITGQVSLPNGMPASGVVVRLVTRAGIPREAFTTDAGRFEFGGMDEGGYTLTATSLSDPNLSSDTVVTDTTRTSTDNLTVNLILRDNGSTERKTPGVIRADDVEQKIPKDARKAFMQGLKLKESKDYDRALTNLSHAIDLFPDYYQALSERGDILVMKRKIDEALADFASALKIKPH